MIFLWCFIIVFGSWQKSTFTENKSNQVTFFPESFIQYTLFRSSLTEMNWKITALIMQTFLQICHKAALQQTIVSIFRSNWLSVVSVRFNNRINAAKLINYETNSLDKEPRLDQVTETRLSCWTGLNEQTLCDLWY